MMVIRKTYSITYAAAAVEKKALGFLLKNADCVGFKQMEWHEFRFPWFVKRGGADDKKFKATVARLKVDFLRKGRQGRGEYYFYRLSKALKRMLSSNDAILASNPDKSMLYGFEDPVFYRHGEKIGEIINHESMVLLCVKENEKRLLKKNGVDLELFECIGNGQCSRA